ncbi:hypothetical protein OENI_30149 [Oenococcus oeni]|nr:hypothetical protein OENI_30149 [Oenococcus oeni]SYW18523.1 hypothetical protein OENI_40081 [Oenococcus oeni]
MVGVQKLLGYSSFRIVWSHAVNNWLLVFAALDKENRDLVFALLMELNKKHKTIVLVTHDLELASKIPRTIQIN